MTIQKLVSSGFVVTAIAFAACAAQAQPTIGGVSNGASFGPTLSPGSLAAVFGTNLMVSGATTTVTVGSLTGFVLAGGTATQINVQIPVNAPVGPTTLTVMAGGSSASVNLTLAAYAPAFFVSQGVAFSHQNQTAVTSSSPAMPGETLTGFATGLGATNPPVATGASPAGLAPTVASVTMTLGSEPVTVGFAGLYSPGIYQINITLPKDASGCNTSLFLTVGGVQGVSAPAVTVPIAAPTPAICAVENSATGGVRDASHGAAGNSFISVYVAGFTGADSTSSLFPSTTYLGTQIEFNGVPMPLYAALPSVNLINTMLPSNAGSSGSGTLTVKNANGTGANYSIELAPADVGVFRLPDPNNASGMQAVALEVGTYWFAMPASLAASYGLPSPCTGLSMATPCGQPVHPGHTIVIYFTGGGLATPKGDPNGQPVPTGSVAPADGSVIYDTVLTPTVTIGGLPATVVFSGIAPSTAAEYQLNVTIPSGVTAGDNVPVVITMGNSKDTVTIAIQTP